MCNHTAFLSEHAAVWFFHSSSLFLSFILLQVYFFPLLHLHYPSLCSHGWFLTFSFIGFSSLLPCLFLKPCPYLLACLLVSPPPPHPFFIPPCLCCCLPLPLIWRLVTLTLSSSWCNFYNKSFLSVTYIHIRECGMWEIITFSRKYTHTHFLFSFS